MKGCPKCGVYGFVFDFKYCPWCNTKFVEGKREYFERINERHTKELYGFVVTKEEEAE